MLQIPGRWEVFIDQLRVSALEDCATFYDSDMAVLLRKHDNGIRPLCGIRLFVLSLLSLIIGAINQTELRVSEDMEK